MPRRSNIVQLQKKWKINATKILVQTNRCTNTHRFYSNCSSAEVIDKENVWVENMKSETIALLQQTQSRILLYETIESRDLTLIDINYHFIWSRNIYRNVNRPCTCTHMNRVQCKLD